MEWDPSFAPPHIGSSAFIPLPNIPLTILAPLRFNAPTLHRFNDFADSFLLWRRSCSASAIIEAGNHTPLIQCLKLGHEAGLLV
jgi:hypothetical protein